ncbi:hypothetical protein AUEXF2481DRAFT_702517 [Aureobasidium subglaciale EXF-2481]|uniref:Uncharacterized protein n=1 Tax=Aureobasidium subglaciale (strain EXF-2481) TaxID=1043005 RepID=A0A074ZJH9_AURSE|nr:uncharacterized protein AUEXF2481DRAFT_702517 [Aureobasidium subglaciale EXF-2481]KEQ98631.1 hypothetical protein AUEXF2481DRAFT_702517 [Aureobasidium subglaciale EXF-2481]
MNATPRSSTILKITTSCFNSVSTKSTLTDLHYACGHPSSVATNPIFLLDDGQDYLEDIKEAMVKHMCGMHYGKSPGNTPHSCKVLVITSYAVLVLAPTYHIAVFTAADRYDCVTVRRAALEAFGTCLSQIRISPRSQTNPDALSEAEVSRLIPLIKSVCGPHAPQLADRTLYQKMFESCEHWHRDLSRYEAYSQSLPEIYDCRCRDKLNSLHWTAYLS